MMRIVAGSAGRLPLKTPRGLDVRPTMDKVRAAVFDSIGTAILGARVADLFAGTGAMGIEALSRGASHATFVERDQRALACIEENLKRTHLHSRAHILPLDVVSYLSRQAAARDATLFDIVFVDPPYATLKEERNFLNMLLGDQGVAAILAEDGLFVFELPAAWDGSFPRSWNPVRDKRYGRTRIVFLRHDRP